MSDTVLIEEEKDIEHIATRKVAVIRKKMMAGYRYQDLQMVYAGSELKSTTMKTINLRLNYS